MSAHRMEPMRQAEAEALAFKRNKHKGKLARGTWTAAHNSARGWHVAFIVPAVTS